ncbi:MAG: hypothetical protein AAFS07_17730 [Pseudomonadota bacterium]
MRLLLTASLLALSASLAQAPVRAQTPDPGTALNAARINEILEQMPQGAARLFRRDVARHTEALTREIFAADPSGQVTQQSVAEHRRVQIAKSRSGFLRNHLARDLNGDGAVTAEEAAIATRSEGAEGRARSYTEMTRADADGDGTVTFAEAVADADAQMQDRLQRGNLGFDLMLLDADGDGVLTVPEATETLAAIGAHVSANGLPPHLTGRSPARAGAAACRIPEITGGVEVVVLSGYEGGALSTVAVAGPDLESEVTTVEIAAGTAPLYILTASHTPMVWRLTGATDRVRHFVVQARARQAGGVQPVTYPGAGVTGLPADRVTFVPQGACFGYVSARGETEQKLQRARIGQRIRAKVDHFAVNYTMGTVTLPEGTFSTGERRRPGVTINGQQFEMTPDGGLRPVEPPLLPDVRSRERPDPVQQVLASLYRFHPLGVIAVDPAEVVAPHPVDFYDVLPQQAGLMQLIQQEKIELTSDGYYRIVEPIPRFPAGLNGSHSVRFVLAPGIEMPGGSPGHSAVISEETGACIGGARCPR